MRPSRFIVKLAAVTLIAAAFVPAAGLVHVGSASAESLCCPGFNFEPLPADTCTMPPLNVPDPPLAPCHFSVVVSAGGGASTATINYNSSKSNTGNLAVTIAGASINAAR